MTLVLLKQSESTSCHQQLSLPIRWSQISIQSWAIIYFYKYERYTYMSLISKYYGTPTLTMGLTLLSSGVWRWMNSVQVFVQTVQTILKPQPLYDFLIVLNFLLKQEVKLGQQPREQTVCKHQIRRNRLDLYNIFYYRKLGEAWESILYNQKFKVDFWLNRSSPDMLVLMFIMKYFVDLYILV